MNSTMYIRRPFLRLEGFNEDSVVEMSAGSEHLGMPSVSNVIRHHFSKFTLVKYIMRFKPFSFLVPPQSIYSGTPGSIPTDTNTTWRDARSRQERISGNGLDADQL